MREPAPIRFQPRDDRVVIEEQFEVITPIFGGGVYVDPSNGHIKEPDPLTPVRASSVRGQLRFWWRATQAHTFATIDALRDEEARLWGAASNPALISLEVDTDVTQRGFPVFKAVTGRTGRQSLYPIDGIEGLAYGAFSLRPETKAASGTPPGQLTSIRGSCTLRLALPQDGSLGVRQAVDAWLLFGGVGGRTRRGFGAVSPVRAPIDPSGLLGSLGSLRVRHAGLSTLHSARIARVGHFRTAIDALHFALCRLSDFRQKPGFARNPGRERPGRSLWPEAETIRGITHSRAAGHQAFDSTPERFPRAAFGMPIIFHFKDVNQGDPRDTQLVPRERERRASPLVLRPLAVDGGFQAMALVMDDPARASEPLELRGGNRKAPVESSLTAEQAQQIRPLKGHTDPLDAFLEYFAQNSSR